MSSEPAQSNKPARRRWSIGTFAAIGLTGSILLVLLWRVTAFSGPREVKDIRKYPEVAAQFRAIHGRFARCLPTSIPTEAIEVSFHASLNDVLQAEPHLSLEYHLPEAAAEAELARLRSLSPVSEKTLDNGTIHFDFVPDDLPRVVVVVDPASGSFLYSIHDD